MLKNEELNLNLLQHIITQEITKYNDIENKQKEIESNISSLKYIIKILDSNDYVEMQQYITLESLLLSILGESTTEKIVDKIYQSAYICANYSNHNDKQQLIASKKTLKDIKIQLKELLTSNKAQLLTISQSITLNELIELKRIKNNLKFNRLIEPHQYNIIKELLTKNKMNTKTIIILLEQVKKHNTKHHIYSQKKKFDTTKTDKIINMLSYGYEKIEDCECNKHRKNQLDSTLNYIINISDKLSSQDIFDYLPTYKKDLLFSDEYDINDFIYLINNLLKYFQNIMFENSELINDYEMYQDTEFRNIISKNYYSALKMYISIRTYADQQYNLYKTDLENQNELDNYEDVYKIYYATKEKDNVDKTYMESDLKDMPNDLYLKIKNLITSFKKNKLGPNEKKNLRNYLAGYSELRDDQIRIIYKHIKNNEYIILGIMLKKENTAATMYKNICYRDDTYYVDAEESIFKILDESYHRGGRKNT